MSKARHFDTKKPKRGRPGIAGEPGVESVQIGVRLTPQMLKALDKWIKDQPAPKPSRPDAVRKALTDWLTGLGLIRQ